MMVTLQDGTRETCHDKRLASGGEGQVYLTTSGTHVVKLYANPQNWRGQTVGHIIEKGKGVCADTTWRQLFCWPDGIVTSPCLGVRMPCADRKLVKLGYFLSPKTLKLIRAGRHPAVQPEVLGTWAGRLGIAIKMARAAGRLHMSGLCHADLSENNFIVDPRSGRVALIDLDGLVEEGRLPATVYGTPRFQAPELVMRQATPTCNTDRHALSVLIYQTLFYGQHPLLRRGTKRRRDIPPSVGEEEERLELGSRALFIEHPTKAANRPEGPFLSCDVLGPLAASVARQAFVDGLHDPGKRPMPAAWEKALVRTADRLLTCPNARCEGKYFPLPQTGQVRCPWCDALLRHPSPLPVLHLQQPVRGRTGHFQSDNYLLVVWPDKTLHPWHTDPTKAPGPTIDPTPVARFACEPSGKWFLCNEQIQGLQTQPGRQPCRPGDRVELTDGLRLLLGPADSARAAVVQFVHLQGG